MKRCKHIEADGFHHCGSYAFNLYKDDIDQGNLCDVHYWQDQAMKAAAQELDGCPVCGSDVHDRDALDKAEREIDRLTALVAQPEQEPFEHLAPELFVVAQVSPADDGFSDTIDRIEKWLREHFSTPPQRTWVGLTDDKLSDIWFKQSTDWMEFARAIEAAHGIKE